MDWRKGDIVTVNFNPKKGDEVGKIRPAIVLSGDEENSVLDTVVVMPLSTQLIDDMQPYRLRIPKRENLKEDSDVLINHIRTLSKQRLGVKIACVTADEYAKIVQYLCDNFALNLKRTKS